MRDVTLYSGFADRKVVRDLRVRQPSSDEAQHLLLPGSELYQDVALCRTDRMLRRESLDQPPRDGGRQQRIRATSGLADRDHQIFCWDVLQQEAAGADPHRIVDVL